MRSKGSKAQDQCTLSMNQDLKQAPCGHRDATAIWSAGILAFTQVVLLSTASQQVPREEAKGEVKCLALQNPNQSLGIWQSNSNSGIWQSNQ